MLCDNCNKRPACVHITKIVNNKKTERHLCEECAKNSNELTFSFNTGVSFNDILKGVINFGMTALPAEKTDIACPACGLRYSEFSRSGKLGCGQCYAAFAEQLEPVIRKIHGACGHTGKIPRRIGGAIAIKQQLRRLRQELERHVAKEEYELAARVRDEIRRLESLAEHEGAAQAQPGAGVSKNDL